MAFPLCCATTAETKTTGSVLRRWDPRRIGMHWELGSRSRLGTLCKLKKFIAAEATYPRTIPACISVSAINHGSTRSRLDGRLEGRPRLFAMYPSISSWSLRRVKGSSEGWLRPRPNWEGDDFDQASANQSVTNRGEWIPLRALKHC